MAQPSYNIENVYKAINTINGYFTETLVLDSVIFQKDNGIIHNYCHYGNNSGKGKCHDYSQKASSGVIYLLKTLKDNCDLEYDKLAEYAILWLYFKLNKKPKNNGVNLNHFYNNYIVKNKDYNNKIKDDDLSYKEIIDKKKDLMDMNINEISKFNTPFNILFSLYNVIKNNNLDCKKYSSYPNMFASKFEELSKDSNNIEGSSYNKMLSTLSDDYNNLKTKYDNKNSCIFPPLSIIEPQKSSAQNTVVNSGKNSGQVLGEASEVTSSSSSILSTLIPTLSTFSVIPVFLGIAYKVNNKELKTIIFL
ncbi:CIR protein PIR protein [Plasmodium vinckei lentum]|uniref:CIR protein PIR protein n=1 Tax=Plasmodium vinckei lentum TaxID=138297 RepID=A0A6V7S5L5_PLAVN|nr:CIR protein PIR protein [Plasmodium vinckei lentum]